MEKSDQLSIEVLWNPSESRWSLGVPIEVSKYRSAITYSYSIAQRHDFTFRNSHLSVNHRYHFEKPTVDRQHTPKHHSGSHLANNMKKEQEIDPDIQRTLSHLRRNATQVVYLPSPMIPPLLSACREDPMMDGHFSVDRTYDNIKVHYWWTGMKHSIKQDI